MSGVPSLGDLIRPHAVDEFLADYWTPGRPLISARAPEVVAALREVDGLATRAAVLAGRKGDVELFGPDGVRTTVSASAARDLLHAGFNLYMRDVHRELPAVRELVVPFARDLGFSSNQVDVEIFVGHAGQVSSAHYDHDINFQILLEGDKTWKLQPNTSIENPLRPFHPDRRSGARPGRFVEEAYAIGRSVPAFDDAAWTSHEVVAGQVVFLPRGHWHEVRSTTDTLAINVVLRGQTFGSGLATALVGRLHRDPKFRAYLDGLAIGDASPPARTSEFAELKRRAIAELEAITLEEAALSSFGEQRFRWVDGADDRVVAGTPPELRAPSVLAEPIELDDESAPHVRALAALRHPFTWQHAQAVLAELGTIGARNLVEDLVALGLLEAKW